MTHYNLPTETDKLIIRLKNKCQEDSYTGLVTYFTKLNKTLWFNYPKQLKDIVVGIALYQTEAVDGDLQDVIDDLQNINWFNSLSSAQKIKKATEIIESL
jgi:hypothetical protein